MATPMHPAGRTGLSRKTIGIIVVVAALVFVASLFAVRAMVGGSTPDAPTGLSVSFENGKVKAAWNRVDGGDEYVLIRDEGTVAYSGSDSTAEDGTAPTGQHTYRVLAANDGRWSSESAETKVTVGSAWGRVAPFMAEYPQLLPQTPEETGWEGLSCRTLVRALKLERGSSDTGSGTPLAKARVHCFNSKVIIQPGWMTSKNAVDQVLADLTKSQPTESIGWRYGTGYFSAVEHAAYLRLSDKPDEMFVVTVDGADKQGVLDVVNAMPLDK